MRSAAGSHELELKYDAADLDAVAAWLDEHYPPLGGAGWRETKVTDRYFDTADKALAEAGYGARLRSIGRGVVVGLKADIEIDAAQHRRNEIEAVATASLDPLRWPPTEARELVRDLARGQRLIERHA